jgi:hypothetical protein
MVAKIIVNNNLLKGNSKKTNAYAARLQIAN